jgi:hypothetical protein
MNKNEFKKALKDFILFHGPGERSKILSKYDILFAIVWMVGIFIFILILWMIFY